MNNWAIIAGGCALLLAIILWGSGCNGEAMQNLLEGGPQDESLMFGDIPASDIKKVVVYFLPVGERRAQVKQDLRSASRVIIEENREIDRFLRLLASGPTEKVEDSRQRTVAGYIEAFLGDGKTASMHWEAGEHDVLLQLPRRPRELATGGALINAHVREWLMEVKLRSK